MKYSQVKQAITASIEAGDHTPTYIVGPPGGGKSTLCLDVAEQMGVPREVAETCIFRPSLHDPVDLLGVPHVDAADPDHPITRWAANHFLMHVNQVAEKYGFALLNWDELPQAVPMMQNAIAGLLLDRRIGEVTLHRDVYQTATGNRTQDKAGAGRMLTQVANRLEILEMETDLDDWTAWALSQGFDGLLVAYLRFRPEALSDFDPDRATNATPRSWEAVARVPTRLPQDIYFHKVAGRVGKGRAAEYVGFRRIQATLPAREEILLNPMSVPIPEEPSARYAATAMLSHATTMDNFAAISRYVNRLPGEFQVFFYKDIAQIKPSLTDTKAFIEWASTTGADLLF